LKEARRVRLEEIDDHDSPVVPLRPLVLDRTLGRLLLPGEISLLYGDSRSVLTIMAHWIAIAGTRRGRASVYLDTGKNFSPNLVRSMVGDSDRATRVLRRIGVGKVLCAQDFEQHALRSLAMRETSVIVLDSLAALLSLTGSPGTVERQRALFRVLERVREHIAERHVHVLMTDRCTTSWSSEAVSPLGGLVLAHSVDSVARLIPLLSAGQTARLVVERSSCGVNSTDSVVVRVTRRGIRPLHRER